MRDIIIVLVITLAVFGGSFAVDKKLEDSGKELINKLEIVQQEVESKDMYDMAGLKAFKKEWDASKDMLNRLTNHQSVDEIDIELNKLFKNYELMDETEALMNIIEQKVPKLTI